MQKKNTKGNRDLKIMMITGMNMRENGTMSMMISWRKDSSISKFQKKTDIQSLIYQWCLNPSHLPSSLALRLKNLNQRLHNPNLPSNQNLNLHKQLQVNLLSNNSSLSLNKLNLKHSNNQLALEVCLGVCLIKYLYLINSNNRSQGHKDLNSNQGLKVHHSSSQDHKDPTNSSKGQLVNSK